MKTQNFLKNGFKSALTASVLGTLLAGAQAFAGPGDAGGGNAVICKNNEGAISKVEVLDYYEAKLLNKTQIYLGAPEIDYKDKVELAIKRLATKEIGLAANLREKAQEFYSSTTWIEGADLEPIADSKHLFIPRNCQITQIAIQKQREFPKEKIYFVNKEIWDKLDNNNKAGLVLHEIIYRKAIEGGATDSKAARYFNALLSSASKLNELTYAEFYSVVEKSKLKSLPHYYNGIAIVDLHFHENGSLRKGLLSQDLVVKVNDQEVSLRRAREITLYENGQLSSGTLEKDTTLKVNDQNVVFSKDSEISFYENGVPKNGTLRAEFTIQVNNQFLVLKKGTAVSFYKNGTVAMGTVGNDFTLKTAEQEIAFKRGSNITFYETGEPSRVAPKNPTNLWMWISRKGTAHKVTLREHVSGSTINGGPLNGYVYLSKKGQIIAAAIVPFSMGTYKLGAVSISSETGLVKTGNLYGEDQSVEAAVVPTNDPQLPTIAFEEPVYCEKDSDYELESRGRFKLEAQHYGTKTELPFTGDGLLDAKGKWKDQAENIKERFIYCGPAPKDDKDRPVKRK